MSRWLSGRTFGSLRQGQLVGAGRERGHTPLHSLQDPAEGADPRPATRRAGPLAQARRSGRRIRAALPLARPASFLPSELGRAEVGRRRRACRLPCAPAPPRTRSRKVPPGWGPSRANPGRAAVGAVPEPAVPPAPPASGRPASGVWGAGNPRGPRSNARGGPRRPARRPQIEPRWPRSEAELCRGRAGYIVSSPRLPPAPFPRLSSLPDPGCAAVPPPVWPSFLPLFSHPYTSLYRTPWGPLRPSPPPWPHGLSCRPLMPPAVRWPGPQCPERGECWAAPEEVVVRVSPGREEVACPAFMATTAASTPIAPPPPNRVRILPGITVRTLLGGSHEGGTALYHKRLRLAESYPSTPCGTEWEVAGPRGRESVWVGKMGWTIGSLALPVQGCPEHTDLLGSEVLLAPSGPGPCHLP